MTTYLRAKWLNGVFEESGSHASAHLTVGLAKLELDRLPGWAEYEIYQYIDGVRTVLHATPVITDTDDPSEVHVQLANGSHWTVNLKQMPIDWSHLTRVDRAIFAHLSRRKQ